MVTVVTLVTLVERSHRSHRPCPSQSSRRSDCFGPSIRRHRQPLSLASQTVSVYQSRQSVSISLFSLASQSVRHSRYSRQPVNPSARKSVNPVHPVRLLLLRPTDPTHPGAHPRGEGPRPPLDLKNNRISGFLPLNYVI